MITCFGLVLFFFWKSALGLQDLGQLHYQPLKDRNGTMVISSTCHLANIKAIPSSMNFKWLPLSKLQRRVFNHEESNAGDLLLASLQAINSNWWKSIINNNIIWCYRNRNKSAFCMIATDHWSVDSILVFWKWRVRWIWSVFLFPKNHLICYLIPKFEIILGYPGIDSIQLNNLILFFNNLSWLVDK